MRKLIIQMSIIIVFLFNSCGKDFLNVVPKDNLTGNNYWKSAKDVDKFIIGIYKTFRLITMGTQNLGESRIFFPATGDFRCAPIVPTSSDLSSRFLSDLRSNNLNALINTDYGLPHGFDVIPKWDGFYEMIQAANIAYYEIDKMDASQISQASAERYKAEVVFLRNLAYFFMVRLYGDVPYYTEAYHNKPLGRTNMLSVLKMLDADLQQHYKNLPWTYEDSSLIGNRAMRGAAITLMMHINMWMAGFTNDSKDEYYTRVVALGEEIMNENGGAYGLLRLDQTKEIFKGRTKEGLFEIVQSLNYGEIFSVTSPYSDFFLRYPNKPSHVKKSYLHYEASFMEKLYPVTVPDQRKNVWYDEYIYNTDGMMQCFKFFNVFKEEGEDYNPDDNQMVFRYVDPILLRAEALAELNRDAEARDVVNIIRQRASATLASNETGQELKDFIWWERARELIGEGHFYYDLVRTKKITNAQYTTANLSLDVFNRKGWTWPIDNSALQNNPYIVLNTYWK